jgi:hypothetical protein
VGGIAYLVFLAIEAEVSGSRAVPPVRPREDSSISLAGLPARIRI